MKKLLILLTALILVSCRTIEVYTPRDIYYLEGLHVFTEMGEDHRFSSFKKRNDWLAQRTADDANICLQLPYFVESTDSTETWEVPVFIDYDKAGNIIKIWEPH
jgi:hypothetical protein